MRQKLITFLFLFCVNFCIFAQKTNRVAYVDVEYILDNLPEYQVASEQLSEKVAQWKKEIEKQQQEIDKRKQELEAQKPLFTPQMYADKQEEIQLLEANLNEYQQKKFGAENGDYINQRWQLAQPIEDQIFNIVQEIGKTKKFDYVFTKQDVSSIYADQKYDLTRLVLRILKRKENEEDRQKDISKLLEENYNYEFKDERTKRKEEAERKRAELIEQRNAEREAKRKQMEAERAERIKQREEELKKRQQERERIKQEQKKARQVQNQKQN